MPRKRLDVSLTNFTDDECLITVGSTEGLAMMHLAATLGLPKDRNLFVQAPKRFKLQMLCVNKCHIKLHVHAPKGIVEIWSLPNASEPEAYRRVTSPIYKELFIGSSVIEVSASPVYAQQQLVGLHIIKVYPNPKPPKGNAHD